MPTALLPLSLDEVTQSAEDPFAASQQFDRFRSEADISERPAEPGL